MPDPQYTDAQLLDGRTLRFMGQLGPDEVRQKVQHFRATESISRNPPGVQRPPNPNMQYTNMLTGKPNSWASGGATEDLQNAAIGTVKGVADVSTPVIGHRLLQKVGAWGPRSRMYPDEAQLQDIPSKAAMMMGPALAGGLDMPEPTPTVSAARPSLPEAVSKSGPGRLSRVVRQGAKEIIPGYGKASRMYQAWKGPQLDAAPDESIEVSRPRLIQQMGGQPPETISDRPSGRLVLSPEEAQTEAHQMSLAKRMASQRGMQYAAGMRPSNPQ